MILALGLDEAGLADATGAAYSADSGKIGLRLVLAGTLTNHNALNRLKPYSDRGTVANHRATLRSAAARSIYTQSDSDVILFHIYASCLHVSVCLSLCVCVCVRRN